MHIDEFRKLQREQATSAVFSLVMACRRKFLNATHLLELRSASINRLSSFGVYAAVDCWPLLSPYIVLAERYLDCYFSPQDDLFHGPREMQDEKWAKYFHHVLVPHLIDNDEVVRNVLRAVQALPSKRPEDAAVALGHFFGETALPETSPLWALDAIVDY
jgi:hypothetical protein